MKSILIRILCVLTLLCIVSCKESKVNKDLLFKDIQSEAKKKDKYFCIIVSDLECESCYLYENLLEGRYEGLKKKAIFNIVKTNDKEHKWYKYWLYTPAVPITCVFDSAGNLKSLVAGAGIKSFQEIERVLDGKPKQLLFGYNSPLNEFLSDDQIIAVLDEIQKCKHALDEGVDISEQIKRTMNVTWYPFNVFLNLENEKKKGNYEEVVFIAEQIQTFQKNNFCNYLYSELFDETKKILQ